MPSHDEQTADLPRLRALVLINPGSRQGADYAVSVTKQLGSRGIDVVRSGAERLADWPSLIDTYADWVDCVVIGGGDGSLSFATESIMRNDLALGVLPLGTANDFARSLGYSGDLDQACQDIAEGVDHRVDVGQVNDVLFLNVASIGLAVRASRYRSDAAKRRFGALGYAGGVYAAFRDTRPFHARVVCDGESRELRTIQLAVGNGCYFGGGLAVAEDAALDDGKLDLFSLEPQGLGEMMRLLPVLKRGPGPATPGTQLMRAEHIRIETTRRRSINTDGEVLTHTPAEFRVLPRALKVRVPSRPATKN